MDISTKAMDKAFERRRELFDKLDKTLDELKLQFCEVATKYTSGNLPNREYIENLRRFTDYARGYVDALGNLVDYIERLTRMANTLKGCDVYAC